MLTHSHEHFSQAANVFCFILSIVFVIIIVRFSVNLGIDTYGWNIEEIETTSTKEEKNEQ